MLRLNLVLIPFPPPATFPPPAAQASMPAPRPSLDRRVLAMGTELRLHLEGTGDLGRASELALAEAGRIEAACSTWDPASAWSRLNGAQGAAAPLASEWMDLLGTAKIWSARTDGAFDPALWALIQAWGLRTGGREPEPRALKAARDASGANLLRLNPRAGTAQLGHPAAGIEEGGFLKGYALDRMKAVAACSAGLLDFGGQILAWGPAVEASIAHPRDRQRSRLFIQLNHASLSTSGSSERGRHILDPRSGKPSEAWGSVAVVAPTGLDADILSTALYVMGPDAGMAYAERESIAAAFLLNAGTIRLSPAFQRLHPRVPKEQP